MLGCGCITDAPPPTHIQELRAQEQSLEKMKLQLNQWDEILREKEKKLQEWVSTREAGYLARRVIGQARLS